HGPDGSSVQAIVIQQLRVDRLAFAIAVQQQAVTHLLKQITLEGAQYACLVLAIGQRPQRIRIDIEQLWMRVVAPQQAHQKLVEIQPADQRTSMQPQWRTGRLYRGKRAQFPA